MCGKKLVSNLKNYLTPLSDITVYSFDQNATRELPCIVVGYDSEESAIKGNFGHYTVAGWVRIIFQGYEDADNSEADDATDEVIEALCDRESLETSLNAPTSGIDTRPAPDFGIHRLFVRGTTRADEDYSTVVAVSFDAFCVAKDI
jgi:hypothetical protein